MKKFAILSLCVFFASCFPNLHSVSDFEYFEEKSDDSYKNLIIYADDATFSRKFSLELYNQLKELGVNVQLVQENKQSHFVFPDLTLNNKSPYQLLKDQLVESNADLLIRVKFSGFISGFNQYDESLLDVFNIDVKTQTEINKTKISSKSAYMGYSIKVPVQKYIEQLKENQLI